MFERRSHPPISGHSFAKRLIRHLALACLALAFALGLGVVGYHFLAGLGWVDSIYNASMILGGMGPADALTTDGAKLFASAYALFSGLVFIGIAGLMIAPIAHRVLHKFHWDEEREEKESLGKQSMAE